MKKVLIKSLAIGTFALMFSGCASIMTDNLQPVTINSSPEGAKIKIDGQFAGKTPVVIQVDRKSETELAIEMEGYETHKQKLNTEINGWFWGNIIIGGLLGSTTDASTGDMYEYAPNTYTFELTKK